MSRKIPEYPVDGYSEDEAATIEDSAIFQEVEASLPEGAAFFLLNSTAVQGATEGTYYRFLADVIVSTSLGAPFPRPY